MQPHLGQARSGSRKTVSRDALRRRALVSRMNWTDPVCSPIAPVVRSGLVGSGAWWSYKPGMPAPDETTNDSLLAAVGLRIRNLRELKRITPKDFAKAAGFSLSYLWRLESGQQNLSLKSISRIAIALGEPMTALLEGIDPDPATVEARPYARKAGKGAKVDQVEAAKDQAQGSV